MGARMKSLISAALTTIINFQLIANSDPYNNILWIIISVLEYYVSHLQGEQLEESTEQLRDGSNHRALCSNRTIDCVIL